MGKILGGRRNSAGTSPHIGQARLVAPGQTLLYSDVFPNAPQLAALAWLRRLPVPIVLVFLALALGWSGPAVPARAADGNVGLVISSGTGQVQTYCFSVPPAGISGLDLLQRTGLPLRVDYVNLGGQICAINGVGCLDPNQPCACQCQGTPCVYWQYAHWRDGRWVASTLGASSYIVKPGSIEGWGWGGNPPAPSGNALCAQAAPATPTSRPASVPTRTPRPTRLPASPTPRPLPARTQPPAPAPPSPTVAAPATAPPPVPTGTPVAPPPTATLVVAPATSASTNTPPPTASVPAPATDTPASTASAPPEAAATATIASPPPAPAAEGPPASYWIFGALVLALAGVIAWARVGRRP